MPEINTSPLASSLTLPPLVLAAVPVERALTFAGLSSVPVTVIF
ncbi:hypothetical protein [Chamaesiphon sp. VAR_48_metabat_403]|nr:hypothetical protein [Chamaesiphon sp. VAR_48_metabat_403]